MVLDVIMISVIDDTLLIKYHVQKSKNNSYIGLAPLLKPYATSCVPTRCGMIFAVIRSCESLHLSENPMIFLNTHIYIFYHFGDSRWSDPFF